MYSHKCSAQHRLPISSSPKITYGRFFLGLIAAFPRTGFIPPMFFYAYIFNLNIFIPSVAAFFVGIIIMGNLLDRNPNIFNLSGLFCIITYSICHNIIHHKKWICLHITQIYKIFCHYWLYRHSSVPIYPRPSRIFFRKSEDDRQAGDNAQDKRIIKERDYPRGRDSGES